MKTPDFSVEQAVLQRCSVRTYDARPVDRQTREKLLSFAHGLSNPFGPGIRVQFVESTPEAAGEKLGTYGFIKGARLYLAVTVPREARAAEALGYEFEQLVLFAASLDLGTCWLGGTFNRGAFASKIEIKDNEAFPILCPIGYPAQKKRFVEELLQKPKADRRRPWEALFFRDDFGKPLAKEQAGAYEIPLEMLRLAPSAVNKQPWRVVADKEGFHFYLKHSLGTRGAAIDMQRIDMGIALCHFHLAAQERGLTGRFENSCPDIKAAGDTEYITSWLTEKAEDDNSY